MPMTLICLLVLWLPNKAYKRLEISIEKYGLVGKDIRRPESLLRDIDIYSYVGGGEQGSNIAGISTLSMLQKINYT